MFCCSQLSVCHHYRFPFYFLFFDALLGFILCRITYELFVLCNRFIQLQFLKQMEPRDQGQLVKKWGNISKSFGKIGNMYKMVSDAVFDFAYPKVNVMTLCPGALSDHEVRHHMLCWI